MEISENVNLKNYTTFKVGGSARYFCLGRSVGDLNTAVSFAREKHLPFFVIGGGSNLLVSEKGFAGLVIKIDIRGVSFSKGNLGEVLATAGAGENWDNFVQLTVDKKLWGLENLSGIPGSVGGTPIQNVGAYGVEVKDVIRSVEVFDGRDGSIKNFSNQDCQFGYRDSFFKTPAGRNFVVTAVSFGLKKTAKPTTGYKDLKEYFLAKAIRTPTLAEVRLAVLEIRSAKFPDLGKIGTAGSFFKNPIIPADQFELLVKKFPGLPGYPTGDGLVKVSLAWILDKVCNLKGCREGGVGLYEKQPLVVVGDGACRGDDIERFAESVISKIKQQTGLAIQWEVERLN
jgi:UDP-N-acetylmuramate dehydrogenase